LAWNLAVVFGKDVGMMCREVMAWRVGFGIPALAGIIYLLLAAKPWGIELGEKPRFEDVVAYWIWFGTAAAAVVSAGLAIVSPWWAGKSVAGRTPPSRTPRWFWPCVIGAMAVSAATSLPRLDYSLWDDEEFNVRRSILGFYKVRKADDDPLKFFATDWREAFFEYREPNNHVLNSVLAKAGLSAWQAAYAGSGQRFTEWPLRLPSFVLGVLSIAGLAWMLKAWGWPGAGVVAAAIFALHPWHVRYVAECRGYGPALLFVPLVLGCWILALRGGRWKWWAGLGAAQFALLYAYPGAAFVLVVLNGLTPLAIFFLRDSVRPAFVQLGRWFCTNAACAVPALVLFMPLIPQMRDYMEYESSRGIVVGMDWVVHTLNHFLAGVAWSRSSAAGAEYPEIVHAFRSMMPVYWGFVVCALGVLLAGIARFLRSGFPGWIFVAATLLPPLVTFFFARSRGHLIYESYVIYALPGVVALAGCGIAGIAGRLAPGAKRFPWRVALAVIPVAAFAALTENTRTWLRDNPLQPIEESALLTRGTLNPEQADRNVLTASFSIPPYLYDPLCIRLESTTALVELMQIAEKENRPLLLNIGMPWAAREFSPGMWALATNPELFEQITHLRGLDPGLDRIIFRYRPGSVTEHDFSQAMEFER
jgi:hypothetical protein